MCLFWCFPYVSYVKKMFFWRLLMQHCYAVRQLPECAHVESQPVSPRIVGGFFLLLAVAAFGWNPWANQATIEPSKNCSKILTNWMDFMECHWTMIQNPRDIESRKWDRVNDPFCCWGRVVFPKVRSRLDHGFHSRPSGVQTSWSDPNNCTACVAFMVLSSSHLHPVWLDSVDCRLPGCNSCVCGSVDWPGDFASGFAQKPLEFEMPCFGLKSPCLGLEWPRCLRFEAPCSIVETSSETARAQPPHQPNWASATYRAHQFV